MSPAVAGSNAATLELKVVGEIEVCAERVDAFGWRLRQIAHDGF